MARYDPKEYWSKRGKTFIEEDYQRGSYWQHDWLLGKLRELKPTSVLEIGCGFGRNLRFFASQFDASPKFIGVDFSMPMLTHAQLYLEGTSIPLAAAHALHLPFADESFDAVVIHGVFMHMPPSQVTSALEEARRVSRRCIIQCEQNYSGLKPDADGTVQINEFTFAYDYAGLFDSNGLMILDRKSVKDLDAFLLAKRAGKYDVPEPIDCSTLHREYSHSLILTLIPEKSRVLDVGCATGYLGRYLAEQRNCTVDGIEPNPEAATVARRFYRQVWVSSIEDEKLLARVSDSYDVVLCAAVLEHVTKPDLVLRCLRRLVAPDGCIIVSLPNIAHWTVRWDLLCGHFDYQQYGLLDRTHLRFYTIKTAQQLIENAGYRIESFRSSTPGVTELERPLLRLPRGGNRLRRWLLNQMPELFGYELIFLARRSQ